MNASGRSLQPAWRVARFGGERDHAMTDYEERFRGIYVLDLLDGQFCAELLGLLRDSEDWSPALVYASAKDGGDGGIYRSETRAATSHLLPTKLAGQFNDRIDSRVKTLVNDVWHVDLRQHAGCHVVRYTPGGHYVEHCDSGVESHARLFSVVCYLNHDFEGGHTSFTRIDYSIKPTTGKAVIFPSNFVHRAEPVIAGEKFVLVTWLTGPPPTCWI
jgi:hypothetical protein